MEQLFIFLTGACGYGLCEILWRHYTHWTMLLTGGICFLVIYNIFTAMKTKSVALKALIGSLTITVTELFCGIIVNKLFFLNVWDYSSLPYNLWGQICLPYSMLWFSLCVPLVYLCDWLHKITTPFRRSETG